MPELERASKSEGKGKVKWCGAVWALLNLRTNQLVLLSRTKSLTERTLLAVGPKWSCAETLRAYKVGEGAEKIVSKSSRQYGLTLYNNSKATELGRQSPVPSSPEVDHVGLLIALPDVFSQNGY